MHNDKPFLIVLVGPTAVGKTEFSIELAKKFNGEIISGDSMQVYKHMDIGTAKITSDEMSGVPHHMIDILEPDETFSAFDFKNRAQQLITEITDRGCVPIIAGGTGLYIQSLIQDYAFEDETITDEESEVVDKKLAELDQLSNAALHQYLSSFDSESAEDIHPNNRKRVRRAIQYYLKTKKFLSSRKKVQQYTENYDTLLLGIEMSRDILYQRINKRVDIMLERGLLDEVKQLVDAGYESCQSMQAIGYKEMLPVVKCGTNKNDAIDKLKQHSRNYAKRQMTWFKNKLDVVWLDKEKMSLSSMLDEVSVQIKKRSIEHEDNRKHPR
ncbi:tRNA dimethylallyltransferase [Staphylococcus equorum]|uniref:tRNA (adenosine(37)-N6)-dimethylallyltransferase MiaA n=1 Tax=Staphylococcus equorum TaxID=246432 RepID=UPI0008533FFC|nr:tRNA (adenosine(37)-N6)-dimethylallyltransferase MiaA [Staphylococcus equorum]MCE5006052.1 tRNA (adenosine(37)-N6)-dimethylallyltransferase MiaA [Staphylococcus equorum]MEB7721106.1 tRNA (adenosine(37)-N6)-dimethylallyltransferase MiaA [Staphylococcus equorum]MEB7746412.1 tRNA (adenosine(37)-N6)-dimethylallyltransferase MiaA [Staphylococcus equorum]OEK78805.1 tRNA dimethylallyltransferase [Staphylococcus equorum]OIS60051.1 tRNA (adenosine(37)-N6)-dimethylallyltransferase MiaA [Staphylococcu